METAQLYKSAYNNQLQQSIYLFHKRKMSQIGEHTLAEQKGHTMILPSVNLLHLMESKK